MSPENKKKGESIDLKLNTIIGLEEIIFWSCHFLAHLTQSVM
jgi:hypothetical protein